VALLDSAGDDEKAEEDEQRAEDADDRIGALTGDVLCAHDGALTPDLKAHHDVRPDHIEPAKYEQNKPHDILFHPPILHPKARTSAKWIRMGSDINQRNDALALIALIHQQ